MGSGKAHVIGVPYPAQGHLIPMMELALRLSGAGIKITVVVTEPIHRRMGCDDINVDLIKFAVILDGLEVSEDRGNVGRTLEGMAETMPGKVEDLIRKINSEDDEEVACLIVDYGLVWPSELARRLKIKTAAFMTSPAALLAVDENIPTLIHQGIIDTDGRPLKLQMIHLSPEMPEISSMNFLWACTGDSTTQKILFHAIAHNAKSKETRDWIICNSSLELEPGALKLVPKSLPIGPLLATNHPQAGYFWQQDSSCLSWLDQQPLESTVYVSFGSSTFLDVAQFQELALALEHSNRPFLLVVREDLIIKDSGNVIYPQGFVERIKNRGKIIKWAPQQKVLSHPSVACFMSHCGWNSTIEGVTNGVPLLCWPYSSDQFINQSYIVDHWGIGLGFEKDECGIIREEEIKNKVEKVLSDKSYKTKTLELQARIKACVEGGSSYKNFHSFVEWIEGN